ncbi:ureide permease 1-like isoform X2 [Phragmites australis]|uniref:ureide permease 1-like isoform X2 n=1 Tax=Phragmites australis TaxID=29695 RepID=UPI002D765611|nr:ureide permease 1-like isoform X2 [Phragmites australis]
MYLVKDINGAIGLMAVALVLLGTWPVVLAVLERRGRLPQHTFLDFSITNFLAAVLIALTFGQIGPDTPETPNFLTQLTQNNWPSILFAMAGGVTLSLGTLATQYGWAFVGLSVTEVMASSLKVVIGTTLNYFLDSRINKAEVLFPGVGCFLIAAILGSLVHSSNAADNQEKLSSSLVNHSNNARSTANEELTKHLLEKEGPKDLEEADPDALQATQTQAKVEAGTAEFLVDLEEKRSIKVLGSHALLGLGIVVFAGVFYALFSPAFNLATNDQWHTLPDGVPHLVVYTAYFYFSLACLAVSVGLNVWFLYRPMVGVPRSTLAAYLRDGEGRGLALTAGMVCGLGNAFTFMAGQAAGYAAADSVQALPLVSTFWGVVLFGEYRRSSRRTYTLLGSMLLMFVVAMAVLMASSSHRKPL